MSSKWITLKDCCAEQATLQEDYRRDFLKSLAATAAAGAVMPPYLASVGLNRANLKSVILLGPVSPRLQRGMIL